MIENNEHCKKLWLTRLKGKNSELEKQYDGFFDFLLSLPFSSASTQIYFFYFIQEIMTPFVRGKFKTKIALIIFKILKNEAKTLFEKSRKNPLTNKEIIDFKKMEKNCNLKLSLPEYDNLIKIAFIFIQDPKVFEYTDIERSFEIFYVLNSFHYFYDFLMEESKPKEIKHFCLQNMLFLNNLLENLIANKILEPIYVFEQDGFFKTILKFYVENSKNIFHPKLIFDYILKFNWLVPDLLFIKDQEKKDYIYEKEFLREKKVFLYCKKDSKKITDLIIKTCVNENNLIVFERLLVLNSSILRNVWLDENFFSHFLLTLENTNDLDTSSKIQIIFLYLNKIENFQEFDIKSIDFPRMINYIFELQKNNKDELEFFNQLFEFSSIRSMIKQNKFKSLNYKNPEQFIRKYFLLFIEDEKFYYRNSEILLKKKKEKLSNFEIYKTHLSNIITKIFPNFNFIKESLPVVTKLFSEYFEFDEKSQKFTVQMQKISEIKDEYDFPIKIIDILNNMLDELIDNSKFIFATINYFKKYFPLVFLYYKDYQDEKLKKILINLFNDDPNNFVKNHRLVKKFFPNFFYDEKFKNNFCEFFINKKIDYEKKSLAYVNQVLSAFFSISPNEQQIFQLLNWFDKYITNFEDISKKLIINDEKLQSLEDEWEKIMRKISELLNLKIKMKKEYYFRNSIFLKRDKQKIKEKFEKSLKKHIDLFEENNEKDSNIYFDFNNYVKEIKRKSVKKFNYEFEDFLKNDESEKKPALQIFPNLDIDLISDYIYKNLLRNNKHEPKIQKKNHGFKKSKCKKKKKKKDLSSNSDKWSSLDEEINEFDYEKDEHKINPEITNIEAFIPVPRHLFEWSESESSDNVEEGKGKFIFKLVFFVIL